MQIDPQEIKDTFIYGIYTTKMLRHFLNHKNIHVLKYSRKQNVRVLFTSFTESNSERPEDLLGQTSNLTLQMSYDLTSGLLYLCHRITLIPWEHGCDWITQPNNARKKTAKLIGSETDVVEQATQVGWVAETIKIN